jgi:hypothetical protein
LTKGDVDSKTTYENYIKTCDLKSRTALSQLLIERGFITDQECFTKLKQVQGEYESSLDPKIGIYRDTEHGPCDSCMAQDENWEERVIVNVNSDSAHMMLKRPPYIS